MFEAQFDEGTARSADWMRWAQAQDSACRFGFCIVFAVAGLSWCLMSIMNFISNFLLHLSVFLVGVKRYIASLLALTLVSVSTTCVLDCDHRLANHAPVSLSVCE